MQKLIEGLARFIDEANNRLGNIVSFGIIPITVIIVYEVVLRYIFGCPTFWAHETSQLMFGSYAVLGGAYCLYQRGHIRIDVIYRRFPLRARAIADVVILAIFLLFCIILLWGAWGMAQSSLSVREHSMSNWAPVIYPFKMVVPLAVALLILQGLVNFTRDRQHTQGPGDVE